MIWKILRRNHLITLSQIILPNMQLLVLNANKISLNIKKLKWSLKQNKIWDDLKLKLCGKRLYLTESVKYLSMKIDTNLSWQYHVNNLSIKLNTASALLFKMRKYVSFKTLRSIYFAVSDSQLSYCSLVWSQNCGTVQRFLILQKSLLESSIFNQGLPIPVSYSSKARS